jgi:hypothetical protein
MAKVYDLYLREGSTGHCRLCALRMPVAACWSLQIRAWSRKQADVYQERTLGFCADQ